MSGENWIDKVIEAAVACRDASARCEEIEAQQSAIESQANKLAAALKESRAAMESAESTLLLLVTGKAKPEGPVADGGGERDDWRAVPIYTALDLESRPIEGLGKTKLDMLIEFAPTLGQWEDYRAEQSGRHEPLPVRMPKGFGEKIVDRIEERLLEFIGRWGSSSSEPAEPDVSPVKDDVSPVKDDDEESAGAAVSLVDGEPEEWVSPVWQDGFDSYNEGETLFDCPYNANANREDHQLWVAGWNSARRLKVNGGEHVSAAN